ncbi:MAG TPA: hypothetical protein VNW72_09095 [Chthoniobacterales bacterium]|jgi:hypothetical protein|nr:hypothetical protein [Chthoniobacterales bacterium]
MDADELDLARKKLAIDTRLRRVDQELARRRLSLDTVTPSGWRVLLTPTGAAVAGAILALLGTAAGKWADYLANRRQQETSVIMKAGDVPIALAPEQQDTQRARNLLWFSQAGYIHLPGSFVAQLQQAAKLPSGQTIDAPIIQSSATTNQASSAEIDLTYFESGMEYDDSGPLPPAIRPSSEHQKSTSFRQPTTGESLDPTIFPYIGLPPRQAAAQGINSGDLCAVYSVMNKKLAFAIYADASPSGKHADGSNRWPLGSIALVKLLEVSVTENKGLTAGLIYIIFPATRPDHAVTPEYIQSHGKELFDVWGGMQRLSNWKPPKA